uniref:Uncharacterized protein n=1 Tax=Streptomyces sp. FR1 TaxID=349971 RepID=V9Z3P7_9ACTN|nr:hypothetical protein [Streptomyces sp. FR1]AHE38743.1 Hypothetical protein pFRL2_68 [Streptomyces sp. FR1]
MNNPEAPSGLAHPEWLADAASWWDRAFLSPATAASFRPLGVDEQGRLHVRCRNQAYAVLLRQLQASVVSSEDFTDRQFLEGVLLEMWHDITQVIGSGHEIFLQLTGETSFDRQVSDWATSQAAAKADVTEPFCVGISREDDASAQDQRLIDTNIELCLAFCSSEAALPAPARLALTAGIPVWRAER